MKIYPAIDLYEGKACRLYKGDYKQMSVYSERPWEIGKDFANSGASWIHIVDLEGAKEGTTPNYQIIKKIKEESGLCCQVGGGIRSIEVIKRYVDAGIDRVILGTAAVTNPNFRDEALKLFGDKIAIGIDMKEGYVAIKGWTERSQLNGMEFCQQMADIGVKTLICTDISRDGAMKGINRKLYRQLKEELNKKGKAVDIIASGGVTAMADIAELKSLDIHGAIIGKAYYTGAIDIKDAIEVAGGK